ncbi:MAG: bifunctional precorrin-2 dehydrogenase/sirohydrochlorin ferrochelatase [Candidatus Poribacteria bacterium]|nr:bifunctional precorrin-2 dehydrogenase/sirohydrochlorin ferrochelatase [Candidatus Poribacteria bacterium]
MYPVFLKLNGVPVLVAGGGRVAERKVARLIAVGANVTLIAPTATETLAQHHANNDLHWVQREASPNDARGYRLVFAATDSTEINEQIAAHCKTEGIWVNVAHGEDSDDGEGGAFDVPSVVERGSLRIAVSTDGSSPALARRLRESLETQFGEEYAALTNLMATYRERASVELPTQQSRHRFYEAALDSDILSLLRSGRRDDAERLLERLLHTHRSESGG